MKKSFKLAALASAILSAPLMAEEPVYVTGGANLFLFDTEVHNLDSGFGPWLGLGYQIDDKWAVELDYNMADTDTRGLSSNVSTDVSLLSLNGVYRYAPVGQNSILLKAGLGKYDLDAGAAGDISETVVKAGAGYEYYIQPNLSATFMWDLLYSVDEVLIDSMPSIGLKYQFGDVKSSSKSSSSSSSSNVQPVDNQGLDSDGDGVVNSQDMCANTPAGVRVNSQGCPFDRDADGVYDYKDECPATPAGAKTDAKGCKVQLAEEVSMDLYVTFPFDSADIPNEYYDEIKKLADFLRQYPDTDVKLVGHADSTGPASYNQMLSEKRAAQVGEYLVDRLNVSKSRITTTGEGESQPIADNYTAQGRAKNRRVTSHIKAIIQK
ncbi:OmpA family protein [Catenovulum adriaticum]|uniref:OmpA family protein n=1 Tax=Catenovulum adriaticum TaxID=2984846 RepID=A0ABY7AIS0_9ALTE|nr:OmpA family protein [Catenovulum sp. TS8]WAJ69502.1 OmpA family protein [Catenovulum sp. TS8]